MRRQGRALRNGRFARNEKGVAAIEFAALAMPFFLTLFALVEVGLIFAGELVLDNAVDRIGRDLRTGNIQIVAAKPEDFRELVCERVSVLFDCDELVIDLAVFNQYADVGTRASGDPRVTEVKGGNLVALRVDYEWPILTHVLRAAVSGKDGKHRMSAIAAFRAEQF